MREECDTLALFYDVSFSHKLIRLRIAMLPNGRARSL
jgi:hypothetical protein